MVSLFWFSIFMIFYAYAGYPLCLLAILLLKKKRTPQKKNDIRPQLPKVSFIITAYNEEKTIEEKIQRTMEQDYPKDRFEIIVASDCSTDHTDEIVKSYGPLRVRLVRSPERKGKENAQKHALQASTGEVIVFSDVATILKPDGVSKIVRNFEDITVGCVSSEDKFITTDGSISGEGAYVKYEMLLRNLETRVNTLVGLSGSFFAARREVCENWSIDLQSDFNTLLNSIKLGYRGISDPNSLGYYKNIVNEQKEFDRKVRTVLRGISVMMRNLSLLNPFRWGLFSWQLFSHKLCRWMVPFCLIAIFFLNIIMMFSTGLYLVLFFLQVGLYVFFCMHYVKKKTPENAMLKIPYFFILVNLSILVAWWKYFMGERAVFWEPSKR